MQLEYIEMSLYEGGKEFFFIGIVHRLSAHILFKTEIYKE